MYIVGIESGDVFNYTDHCTAFYDSESGMVFFYDKIRNRKIGKKKVSGKVEAEIVMRVWQDNAPEGIICELVC